MKDVHGAEDIHLFFGPSENSQLTGKEFVDRIFTHTEGRDTVPDMEILTAWHISPGASGR